MNYLRLDEVCNINMGQSPSSASYNQERKGIPFFQGNADFGEMYPITRVWCEQPIKIVDRGTLLISVRAPIGSLNFAIEKSCIGRGLAGLTTKAEYDLKYIYYVLKYKEQELNNKGTGSTFKAVSKSSLGEVLIPDISIKKQKNYVRKLDLIQKTLNDKKKQIEQMDTLIKARFVEMFGDIILNDKHWDECTWEEVLIIKNGKNQKQVENPDGKYVICGSGGVIGFADDYICNEKSVIIGRKGNINKPILMKEKYWNVDTAFGLEPLTKHLDAEFLYMFCVFFDFNQLDKAVTIPSLTKADLLKIRIPVPPIELQEQFAAFVRQTDKSKVAIQKALDETQILFDSLMQKYFV